jgi:hydrogenase nickel incorporation protein HypA/HybF
MHELSIAQSIIAIVEKSVPAGFNQTITAVDLEIGVLSGIEIQALENAFSIIKNSTILRDSVLKINIKKGKATCTACKTIFELSGFGESCPNCNSYEINITEGKEMKVVRFTVD